MYSFADRIKFKLERMRSERSKRNFLEKMEASGNTRPSSFPYISSDSFRALCDYTYDAEDSLSFADHIKSGDKVFVNSDLLESYFSRIHSYIKEPYILISHQGITPVDGRMIQYLDDMIIHWFAKNTLIKHPKVTPLPIGLENLYKYGTGIPDEFNRVRRTLPKKRTPKVLYEFKVATNPKERGEALDFLKRFDKAETYQDKMPHYFYLKKMTKYMFVASPPGAGRECHRTWEALYVDTIPIVKRSVAEEYFYSCGVPLLIVDSWKELENMDLAEKYAELMNHKNDAALWMDYWVTKIEEKSI